MWRLDCGHFFFNTADVTDLMVTSRSFVPTRALSMKQSTHHWNYGSGHSLLKLKSREFLTGYIVAMEKAKVVMY